MPPGPFQFTDNSEAVNTECEKYVLTIGGYDEKLFWGEYAEEEINSWKGLLTADAEATSVLAKEDRR